ncbi:MAG: hypothetical protein WCP59_10080 [Actinomycetota bacterium]|jgi:hypothetical protein
MNDNLDERTSTLLTAVEQQLTRYFASISRQVDTQRAVTTESLESQRRENEAYQEALRAALEDRLTAFAQHQHERLVAMEEQVDDLSARPAAAEATDTSGLMSRLDATERQLVDRLVELEHRINDEQGRRIAELEAVVGRLGNGFDEAISALSQRLLDLDGRVADLTLRTDDLAATSSAVSAVEVDSLREMASAAASDTVMMRFELDRLTSTATKHFDHQAARLAEIEQTLHENRDVAAAVQLDRLDEVERQLIALDPALAARLGAVSAPTDANPVTAEYPVVPIIEPVTIAPAIGLPEPIFTAAEPALASEPLLAPAPLVAPEPMFAPEPTFRPEPTFAPESTSAPASGPLDTGVDRTAEMARPTLTRRMAAPPPMTLVPRLPSTRPSSGSDTEQPHGPA